MACWRLNMKNRGFMHPLSGIDHILAMIAVRKR